MIGGCLYYNRMNRESLAKGPQFPAELDHRIDMLGLAIVVDLRVYRSWGSSVV
mgnify:CR=1 FL=1